MALLNIFTRNSKSQRRYIAITSTLNVKSLGSLISFYLLLLRGGLLRNKRSLLNRKFSKSNYQNRPLLGKTPQEAYLFYTVTERKRSFTNINTIIHTCHLNFLLSTEKIKSYRFFFCNYISSNGSH